MLFQPHQYVRPFKNYLHGKKDPLNDNNTVFKKLVQERNKNKGKRENKKQQRKLKNEFFDKSLFMANRKLN